MTHERINKIIDVEFVAAEEESFSTKAGNWLSRVYFKVSGPDAGLWVWTIIQACGKAVATGYADTRNDAICASRDYIVKYIACKAIPANG